MNSSVTMTDRPATLHPAGVVDHLCPHAWTRANRALLRKAIAEFAHEMILEPLCLGRSATRPFSHYRLPTGAPGVEYRFEAHLMELRHWRIDESTLKKYIDGVEAPPDALMFIIEMRDKLEIPDERLPIYLDEISSTLHGACYKLMHPGLPSDRLAHADYQTVETSMSEGHPCFVANNGRLGFDAHDYHRYAPETAAGIQVLWLAVHRRHTQFSSSAGLDYQTLLLEELGQAKCDAFAEQLHQLGLDPTDYYFMPAHPWQWFNKLSVVFSPYVATRQIVCLGYGEDRYLAQQSIRTFFNISHPHKRYVKTSLSILNMGFMRGLSPYYMAGTPAINDHIHQILETDPVLRANGFRILREVASLGFRNRYYEAAIAADSPYKKMFSALWRENPTKLIAPHQRLMTMAALLHVDHNGKALVSELINASGLDARSWLDRYVGAYLIPLLQCFYQHNLVFMPHGENLILVIENCIPVRVFMKDIAEESSILDKDASVPPDAHRLVADVPDNFKLLSIFVDIFDGFFRHLSAVLMQHQSLDEADFWCVIAGRIATFQSDNPQHRDKFVRYDLFAEDMMHSCLNRLQLANNLQMVNLADPTGSFRMAPALRNPIHRYRPNGSSRQVAPRAQSSNEAGRQVA